MLSSGVLQAGVAFGSNLVLVRFISPQEFGRFALFASTMGLVTTCFSLRLPGLFIRLPSEEYDDAMRQRLFSANLLQALAMALLMTVTAIATGALSPLTGALIAGMTLSLWNESQRAAYERRMFYSRIARIESGAHLFAHTLAATLAVAGVGEGALYLRELALAIAGVTALAAVGGLERPRFRLLNRSDWRIIIRALPTIWSDALLAGVFAQVRVLSVGFVAGEQGTGHFVQALRLAMVPHQLIQPVTGRLALNWFSREEDARRRMRHRRRLLLIAAVPLATAAVALVALAPVLIPWLFGEAWRPSVPYTIALAGTAIFLPLSATDKMFLVATNRLRVLLVARFVQFAVFLAPVAIHALGVAAVQGTTLAYALSAAFMACAVVQWVGISRQATGATGNAERSEGSASS